MTLTRYDGLVHGFVKLGFGEAWSRRAILQSAEALQQSFANRCGG